MQLKRLSGRQQDYSAPIVFFGIAAKHPDWIKALILQNGNAHEEGLKDDFWNAYQSILRRIEQGR
ncbi:MAG: hypothetical protein M3247_00990 [Thermoproteota archaeon]|nr:hypothetical protein [Thermoproteota archaeon]